MMSPPPAACQSSQVPTNLKLVIERKLGENFSSIKKPRKNLILDLHFIPKSLRTVQCTEGLKDITTKYITITIQWIMI